MTITEILDLIAPKIVGIADEFTYIKESKTINFKCDDDVYQIKLKNYQINLIKNNEIVGLIVKDGDIVGLWLDRYSAICDVNEFSSNVLYFIENPEGEF